ncbi:MAG TPA: serine hydrolase [Candidatus Dormibacteraeota bacterium]
MIEAAAAGQQIQEAFHAAGVDGFLHAVDVDRGTELGHQSDELVVLASVFKVPLLVEFERQVAEGRIDERERARVPAGFRVPGPTGISAMLDDVELSWRDLAQLMIAVSDNTATDFLAERIGLDDVARTLRGLGLEQTVIDADCRAILRTFQEDLGLSWPPVPGDMERVEAAGAAAMTSNRSLRPETAVRSTAREIARLFTLIWRDEAGPAEACAEMRRILLSQVWRDRLRSGFGGAERIGGKTGTLWGIRNEAGVVEVPGRGRVAVAVFTRSFEPRWNDPAADHVIGTAARIAVDALLEAAA